MILETKTRLNIKSPEGVFLRLCHVKCPGRGVGARMSRSMTVRSTDPCYANQEEDLPRHASGFLRIQVMLRTVYTVDRLKVLGNSKGCRYSP